MKLKEAVVAKPGSKYDKIAAGTIHGALHGGEPKATPESIVSKLVGKRKEEEY